MPGLRSSPRSRSLAASMTVVVVIVAMGGNDVIGRTCACATRCTGWCRCPSGGAAEAPLGACRATGQTPAYEPPERARTPAPPWPDGALGRQRCEHRCGSRAAASASCLRLPGSVGTPCPPGRRPRRRGAHGHAPGSPTQAFDRPLTAAGPSRAPHLDDPDSSGLDDELDLGLRQQSCLLPDGVGHRHLPLGRDPHVPTPFLRVRAVLVSWSSHLRHRLCIRGRSSTRRSGGGAEAGAGPSSDRGEAVRDHAVRADARRMRHVC